MTISLGTISFDEAILLRQLRQDMRDDWFPDALGYQDLMRSGDPRARIEQNFNANHGRYVPTSRDVFNIPKPNFTVRYGLETSICDRIVYHALASSISVHIDPLIPPVIYSHRRDPHRRDERYLFRRSTAAWQDFVGSVRADLHPGEQLLSTDLTNYFDNIDLVKLRDLLSGLVTQANCSPTEKAQLRSEVTLLFQLLQDWTFEIGRGLPQNRDASSFLANVYMLPIDLAMRAKGYRYFRYMDDIKVICPDVYAARRALKDLIVELRDRGLAVNSKKTTICAAENLEAVNDCLDAGSPDIAHLDALWATRSRQVVARSFPLLRQLTERALLEGDGERIDTREFRYCMNRMVMLATCSEFAVPPAYFESVTQLVVQRLADHPAATDQFVRYLRAVPLGQAEQDGIAHYLLDDHRSLYGWQNYRLWKLMGQRGFARPDLIARARTVLAEKDDGASRAGATLYLGSLGADEDREHVAARFGTLRSFLGQRAALVALQGLPFAPSIRDQVAPHVRTDLHGVYRALNRRERVYFSPLESTSISQIIDAERDYA